MKKPLRVATYSRVSTNHHSQKPEVQTHELRRYCETKNGWQISHEIVDHGYSGGTDDRPGLKRLLGLVKSREVDAVVVLKLDRLFRSMKHLVITLEEFQSLGIQFIAVTDNVDYTTPSGRLFVQLLGSLAEFERSLARERTMMGLAYAKAQGKHLGRPKLKLESSRIVEMNAQGRSLRQIAKNLRISKSTVDRALKACRLH